jgi:predicted nucleic acid-binding protein
MILDACVLINLLATGRLESIAATLDAPLLICDVVREETLFLRNPPDAEEPREPIDLAPFITKGVIEELTLRPQEEAAFVDYATQLEDGEAMTIAIALSRNVPLATDERKARRLYLNSGGSEDDLFSTSSILRTWSERQSVEVGPLLKLIETRARFWPGKTDPLRDWWQERSPSA